MKSNIPHETWELKDQEKKSEFNMLLTLKTYEFQPSTNRPKKTIESHDNIPPI